MASYYSMRAKRYSSERTDYVAKMTSHSVIAADRGKKYIIDQAMSRAPSHYEERQIMTAWEVKVGQVVKGSPDYARVHFGKGDEEHMWIQDAIEFYGPGLFEDYENSRVVGFLLRSVDILDEKTRFYWVNEDFKGNTYGPFDSRFGTFSAFEFGMAPYSIQPIHGEVLTVESETMIKSGKGGGGVEVRREIPKFSMFSSIDSQEVIKVMEGTLREQEG